MTLRTRLTAAFVLVVLVPLLVVVALLTTVLPAAIAERQAQGLTSSSRLAAAVVASLCDRARAGAEAAARVAAATTGPDDAALRPALEELVRRGLADGMRVTTADGTTAGEAGQAPDVPSRDCSTGQSVRTAGAVQIAAVVSLNRRGGGTQDSPAGAAVAAFTVDDALARTLRTSAGVGEVVLLAAGQPVAASAPVPGPLVRAAVQAETTPVSGWDRIAVLTPARPGQPVAVLVSQRQGEGPGVLLIGLTVTAGAVLLAAVIALLLARATTRPLGELGAAAARVAGGDLETTIEVRSRDELGHLAASFNTMTGELRRYVGALQASRDELQAGVARIGDTLSGTHDLDRILTVVLDTAMSSTRAQAGAVFLLSADGTHLELAVGQGLEERGVACDLRLPVGAGVAGRVARSGEAVRGWVAEGLTPDPGEPAAQALLAVPLKSSANVIGVLTVYDRADGEAFEEADLVTLRTFTSQATVAVDNVLLHEEARRLSITDGLTGLANYRHFAVTIGREIERAARFGRPLGLLLLDLDHFKLVNDVHGHQRGDAVLVDLAARVRGQVRDVDTLARYGGEEFVVLLPETDEEGAVQAAERIRAAVRRRPFGEPGEPPLEVSVSVGVAVFPAHGATSTMLLRRADEALYAAKRAGRDTWRLAEVSSVES
ncbi:MAG: diguanylate cyclase [Mycobacteriales bacterium]